MGKSLGIWWFRSWLTGQRFGRLVVLRLANQDEISAYGTGKEGELGKNAEENAGGLGRLPDLWLCRCDCGNVCVCQKENLRDGKTKSCGCFRNETRQKNMRKAIHFVDGTLGPSLRFMRRYRRG